MLRGASLALGLLLLVGCAATRTNHEGNQVGPAQFRKYTFRPSPSPPPSLTCGNGYSNAFAKYATTSPFAGFVALLAGQTWWLCSERLSCRKSTPSSHRLRATRIGMAPLRLAALRRIVASCAHAAIFAGHSPRARNLRHAGCREAFH
jgi:hypothetical protein